MENGDFSIFASFNIAKRTSNIGSLANIDSTRDMLMEKYDRWIMAEDDLEFAPVFLEYMNKCLVYYENDPVVFAVNGYAYPISYNHSEGSNVIKQYATVSEWGIGYWKDKYLNAQHKIENGFLRDSFDFAVQSGKLESMVKSRRYDYINYALSGNDDPLYTHMTDISMGIYCNLADKCVISPVVSKTRNHGFDGTGLYCGVIEEPQGKHSMDMDYENQFIDESETIEIIPDQEESFEENKRRLDAFLYESPERSRRISAMYKAYQLIGQKNCARVYRTLKNLKTFAFGKVDRTSF